MNVYLAQVPQINDYCGNISHSDYFQKQTVQNICQSPIWSDLAGAGTTIDERRSGNIGTELSSENSQGKKSKISKGTQLMI